MDDIEQKLSYFNKLSFRGPIGFFIVAAGFSFLFMLMYKTVPAENKDVVMFAAGLVLGIMKDVSGFFFGASKDHSDAAKAANVKDIIAADEQAKSVIKN